MRVISGLARGHKLKTVENYDIRPTLERTKEAVFSMINSEIYGSYFLDVFSGTGSIGIEALSRGADFCAFIELSREHCDIINQNIEHVKKAIGDMKYQLVNSGFEDGLIKLNKYKFDIIFMDPPYGENLIPPALDSIKKGNLLKEGGIVIVEQRKDEDVPFREGYRIIKNKNYGTQSIYFLQYECE